MTRFTERRFLRGLIALSFFVWGFLALSVVPSAHAIPLTGTISGSRYLDGMAVVVQSGPGGAWQVIDYVNSTPDIRLSTTNINSRHAQYFPRDVGLNLAPDVKNVILFNMKPLPSGMSTDPPWMQSKDVGFIGTFNVAAGFQFEQGGTMATTFDTEESLQSEGRPNRWFALRDSFNTFDTTVPADLITSSAIASYDPLTNPATLFRGNLGGITPQSENANSLVGPPGNPGGWIANEASGVLPGISSFADLLGYGGNQNFPRTNSITFGVGIIPNPEPATFALLAGGLGLIGFVARRRKREEDLCKPPDQPV